MKIFRQPDAMRAWSLDQKAQGRRIGLVPTMGALHDGHASLLRAAVQRDDRAVASIFVNPAQFAPHEDFEKYPRTFEADCAIAERLGIHAIYAPTMQTMYPDGYATYVTVERLTQRLCGASRPTHFRGVATVVAKLFNAVLPDRAYFGQKDAQQCAVIRRMVRDLDLPIEIVELPIVRDPDGLALSSRNAYLSRDERAQALCLSRALDQARVLLDAGERDPARIINAVRDAMAGVEIDYVELVDADDMQPVPRVRGAVLLAVAAFVGKTRLIDNIQYEVKEP